MNRYVNSLKNLAISMMFLLPGITFADSDPFASAGTGIMKILFGPFGMVICTLAVAGVFVMAKFGKASWVQVLVVILLVAGFLGAPNIVSMIKSWV